MADVYRLIPHTVDECLLAIYGNAVIVLAAGALVGIYAGIEKLVERWHRNVR